MKRRDLRLLPLAVGVWGSALFCVFVPGWSTWVVVGCVAGALVAFLVARRPHARNPRGGGGLALLLFAAMAAVAVTAGLATPSREHAVEWSGRVVEVTADVSSSASLGQDGRLWFEAQTRGIGIRGDPVAIAVPVRIGVDPGEGFDLGAGVRVVGQAMATDAGERSALIVFATEAEVVRPADGLFGIAAGARQAFIDRSTQLPEPGAGLLPGLAVGDTRAVTSELNDDMRTSGLSHLTAVSGDTNRVRGGSSASSGGRTAEGRKPRRGSRFVGLPRSGAPRGFEVRRFASNFWHARPVLLPETE